MPKIVELTVEIEVQKVTCPGVWLCQDGRVSLSVYALGTSYQTCLLPPMFPLLFKDVFYFKKRFEETCAVNNIGCLLKDETIYCELVQWSEEQPSEECVVLAQYLGNLGDVLFPPNMCSSDGVDLLMRRSKNFPGILSPKIEVATKVRIDEVWNPKGSPTSALTVKPCECSVRPKKDNRQTQVCHSAQYHRNKCMKSSPDTKSRCPSGSRSNANSSFLKNESNMKSCCNLNQKNQECKQPATTRSSCKSKNKIQVSEENPSVINNDIRSDDTMRNYYLNGEREKSCTKLWNGDKKELKGVDDVKRMLLESRFIDTSKRKAKTEEKKHNTFKFRPCVCEICRKYHDFFHGNS